MKKAAVFLLASTTFLFLLTGCQSAPVSTESSMVVETTDKTTSEIFGEISETTLAPEISDDGKQSFSDIAEDVIENAGGIDYFAAYYLPLDEVKGKADYELEDPVGIGEKILFIALEDSLRVRITTPQIIDGKLYEGDYWFDKRLYKGETILLNTNRGTDEILTCLVIERSNNTEGFIKVGLAGNKSNKSVVYFSNSSPIPTAVPTPTAAPKATTAPSDEKHNETGGEHGFEGGFSDQNGSYIYFGDGRFSFSVNLAEGYGNISGSYNVDEYGISCFVDSRDFYGFTGDDVDYIYFEFNDFGLFMTTAQIGLTQCGEYFYAS